MKPRLFLDIETIPTTRLDEMARIGAEALAKNALLKRPRAVEDQAEHAVEVLGKTALDGAFGEVVCIAAAVDNEPVRAWSRDPMQRESEADLLRRFAEDLRRLVVGEAAVVGHNVIGFDRPFLRQRSIVVGVPLPRWLTAAPKPWEATDVDTMLMWTNGAPNKHISLDRLARALGLAGKTMNGGDVWAAVLAGRMADVVTYCMSDVELVRRVYQRMTAHTSTEASQ